MTSPVLFPVMTKYRMAESYDDDDAGRLFQFGEGGKKTLTLGAVVQLCGCVTESGRWVKGTGWG